MRFFRASVPALVLILSACTGSAESVDSAETTARAPQSTTVVETTETTTTAETTTPAPTAADSGAEAGPADEPEPEALAADPLLGTIGDASFPGLGNTGYDVQTYNIGLDLTGPELQAETVVRLRAQQDLEQFHLDLVGMTVKEIRVDDEPAVFTRDGRELVVRPGIPLTEGNIYEVLVAYEGTPEPIADPAAPADLGWITEPWGTYVVSEPLGGATWFPGNDHPRDKATFQISVTVPAATSAMASGKLVSVVEAPTNGGPDGSSTYLFEATDPMATYLASVVTGDFELSEPTEVNGIQIRHAVHRSLSQRVTDELQTTAEMMEAFEEQFGPYPFEAYGVVVVPEDLGFALENQTLSIFGRDIMTSVEAQPILAHELAHQWFGNSVSVHEWDDIWLNEGFATWAEFWWRDRLAGPPSDFFELVKEIPLDPLQPVPADELFDANVYFRGGLTLETYERSVGAEAFREFLLEWSNRYGNSTASSEQFVELVEELHGPEIATLLTAWIEDTTMPVLIE